MIKKYERLPAWTRWVLLLPMSFAFSVAVTMCLKFVSSLLYGLFLPTAAIVSFVCAIHTLAPRWENRFVVVSLILRMVFAVVIGLSIFITGVMPNRTLGFEMGMELLGWAAGWFLYFSVFREKKGHEPRVSNSEAEPLGRQTPLGSDIRGGKRTRHVDQMWHTLLASDDLKWIQVAQDEVDDVVSLMIESRIDVGKFSGNLEVLFTGGHRAMEEMYLATSGGGAPLPSTPSISKFARTIDRPPGLPLWFLAGFPDVFAWFEDEQLALFNPSVDEEARVEATAKLLGLDFDASQNSDAPDFHNDDGTLHSRYCRNIVANYIRKTGEPLEAAVQEGSDDDIYLGSDFLQMVGEESNFTLVASMTTKYYLELKKRYGRSFPNETSLLSMSGILDANYYIFASRQITVAQVIAAAKETEGEQDRMYEFLIRFEALYLSVDETRFSGEEVLETCRSEAEAIRRSIERTTASYKGEPMIVNGVHTMMSSPQFLQLRQEVGVATIRS